MISVKLKDLLNSETLTKLNRYLFLAKCHLINSSPSERLSEIDKLSSKIIGLLNLKKSYRTVLKTWISQTLIATDEDFPDYLIAYIIACSKTKSKISLISAVEILDRLKRALIIFESRYNEANEILDDFFTYATEDKKVDQSRSKKSKQEVKSEEVWDDIEERLLQYDLSESQSEKKSHILIQKNLSTAEKHFIGPHNSLAAKVILIYLLYANLKRLYKKEDYGLITNGWLILLDLVGLSMLFGLYKLNAGQLLEKESLEKKLERSEQAKLEIEKIFTDLFPCDDRETELTLGNKEEVSKAKDEDTSKGEKEIQAYFDPAYFNPNSESRLKKTSRKAEKEKFEEESVALEMTLKTMEKFPISTWLDGKINSEKHHKKLIAFEEMNVYLLIDTPGLSEQAKRLDTLQSLLDLVEKQNPKFVKAKGRSGIVKTGPYHISLKCGNSIIECTSNWKIKNCGQKSRILLTSVIDKKTNALLLIAGNFVKNHVPNTTHLTMNLKLERLGIESTNLSSISDMWLNRNKPTSAPPYSLQPYVDVNENRLPNINKEEATSNKLTN